MGKKNVEKEPELEEEDEEEDEENEDEGSMEEGSEDEDMNDDGGDMESEVDEDEHEMEKAALLHRAHAKTPKINKEAELMEKLGDIMLGGGKKVPWSELFYVSSRVPAESIVEDVDDDLKRELAFYDIALAGVKDCQEMCKAASIPYERPKDYYAEMVKTDEHMLKVKRQLLEQAAKVEASEMRRKQRDAKKYGKALQTERRVEKEKRKHDDLAEITKWRKNKPAGEGDREKDEALFNMAASKQTKKKGLHEFIAEKTGRRDDDGPQKSSKRLASDKKYGRGGRARTLSKRNTFESSHDMSDFSVKKNKAHGMSVKKDASFKGGGGGKSRPGKERRSQSRGGGAGSSRRK